MSKTVYLFDEITGEFIGEYLAQQSPLEAGVYIEPVHSTDLKPLSVEQGKYNHFDGVQWTLKDDTRGIWFKPDRSTVDVAKLSEPIDATWARTEPPKTLAELKAYKNAEINAARLSANQTIFTHGAKTFSCDQLSRSDIDGINGYIATRNALPTGWVGGWKATDNSILPIPDIATWNAFYDSLIAQGQANFVHSQTLKAALANATTQAEIDAIAW